MPDIAMSCVKNMAATREVVDILHPCQQNRKLRIRAKFAYSRQVSVTVTSQVTGAY